MVSSIALLSALLTGIVGYMIASKMLGNTSNAREPPAAPSSIPVIGHAMGLMKKKFEYYVELSQRISQPVFTLQLPGQKMYVVTTPELVQSIQKQSKILAFPPIEAKFASTVCGVSQKAQDILNTNVNGDEGDWGLSMEAYAGMRSTLKAGKELDDMNRVMINNIEKALNSLDSISTSDRKIQLVTWLRDAITEATTDSVYGPENPFQNKEIVQAFWDFESELMTILVGIAPSITARQGIASRDKVARAFEEYFRTGGHEKASHYARDRYEVSARNGVPLADIGRYEVGGSIAVLVNTTPAAYWMLFHIFAHLDLLEAVRKEIDAVTREVKDEQGNSVRQLDVTSLKSKCPLFASTYQEVLRFRSMGTSVREVMEDTILDDRWLLKKGCMVQMPSRILHRDASLWGSDVDQFNPRRFLKGEPQKTENGKRASDMCFRAFGGGKTLCPGRHFATNEVLAVVGMFVARFDLRPTSGEWMMPTTSKTNVAAVVMEPDTDIEVEVSPRKGLQKARWTIELQDSGQVLAVVAEDQQPM